MKKIFISICICALAISSQAQNYFQASVKKNGTNLEFYLRLLPGGSNVSIRFDDINFQIRWPNADPSPITGAITVNTIDFPGLVILDDPYGFEGYGSDLGYKIKQFTPQVPGSVTSAVKTYTAGQEYLVFSVAVSNAISLNIQLAANNEDGGAPYYCSFTKNNPLGGQSDYTSHNLVNGNITNQFFYASNAALLSTSPGAGGTTNFFQRIVPSGVVPVKFTSFSATKKDNDAILSWLVENETSLVTTYEIERSIDGIKFDKINTIAKNGGISNIYNITDANLSALKNRGIIYYRIKQMDVNGEFVYSDIKSVRMNDKGTLISIFPNPVVDITTVKIDVLEATDGTISLINADGKQLQTSTLKAAKGLNLKKIDMNNLPKGDYLLKVMLGTELQTIKVVKL
jgi:Secretion system C-terminal sorting domain